MRLHSFCREQRAGHLGPGPEWVGALFSIPKPQIPWSLFFVRKRGDACDIEGGPVNPIEDG